MQEVRIFSTARSARRLITFILCALVVILAGYQPAQAQAGRRAAPRKDPPATAPAPEQSPADPSASKPEASKLSLLVTYNLTSGFVVPEIAFSIIDGFIKRLKDSPALTVDIERDMNRRRAIERAAAGRETYVIWVFVQPDVREPDRPKDIGPIKSGNLVVNYTVFAPVTARVKTAGRVYCLCHRKALSESGTEATQQATLSVPVEYTLEQSGRAAADRVIEAFELPLPTGK